MMAQDEKAARAEPGFLRLRQIIGPAGPIPISKSTWWEGVRDGRFPAPIKITPQPVQYTYDVATDLPCGEHAHPSGPGHPSSAKDEQVVFSSCECRLLGCSDAVPIRLVLPRSEHG